MLDVSGQPSNCLRGQFLYMSVAECGKYDACPSVSRQRLRSAFKRPLERDRHVTSSANVLPEGRQDPGSR
ncbi:hypothetical protein cypCar_00040616 [Cyprinus carpio]|nr:hypothetical protein cypCar_00040616 [Cyprinus carpio]